MFSHAQLLISTNLKLSFLGLTDTRGNLFIYHFLYFFSYHSFDCIKKNREIGCQKYSLCVINSKHSGGILVSRSSRLRMSEYDSGEARRVSIYDQADMA